MLAIWICSELFPNAKAHPKGGIDISRKLALFPEHGFLLAAEPRPMTRLTTKKPRVTKPALKTGTVV